MRASVISLLVAGLLAPFAFAAPAERATVTTPHGERLAANAHEVPAGGRVQHVGDEIHLIDADGKVLHVAQNDHAKVRPTSLQSGVAPLETGWVAYASWYDNGSPIETFTTNWVVPPNPSTNHGQTIFLFNSIEPASYDAIIQPVLQWGGSAAGGGYYWAVASWYLVGSNTYYTTPVQVSVGETLDGYIYLVSGTTNDYVTEFTNVGGSALQINGGEVLVWATETLEVYGVTEISDYPSGATSFTNINIRTSAGTPSISWSASSDTADGVICTVSVNGATNAIVTVNY